MKTKYKHGDIIEFCGDSFMILKNYGESGRVQEYFQGGNMGIIIDPFYWKFENEECKLAREGTWNL